MSNQERYDLDKNFRPFNITFTEEREAVCEIRRPWYRSQGFLNMLNCRLFPHG